ncbi:30S ribosomal protein S12 methylthiotransferase RimO [Humisphaera borealis]|uniref:Ribosomal protein uS12 methylthiotransferase RimO n=1 Tax=Humisphaera borealis TaxID=2807512 RepID=A0A7M2WUI7_9BACT|nr:30S ribosomal protein S12 methylthiotransferase RimO [Humisphaera borealis]QOV89109.1 30S ribosomal protein S12 methylthiotransferase RimO [Humisphaera borealis]
MPKPSKSIKSVAFVSLGCPKNLVDSERMLGLLAQDGLAITPDADDADVIVINTCGFLEASKDESLKEIRDAIELKKAGKVKRVVVAGCLVQRHKTKLLNDAPGIDRLVGVFDREHIVEAVRGKENPRQEHGHFLGKYHDLSKELAVAQGLAATGKETKTSRLPVFEDDRARLRLTPRHYAYLRISEGCNQGCTFCTIPSIRGPMRSKPVEQILLEAKELAADGAVELNLIGQDTTSFGTDIGYGPGLSGLLKALDKGLKDVHWLRLMYAYPSCFTDEMIKTIADSAKLVKYIDMPLQHINDELLTVMRRRVTKKEIVTLLEKLRKWVPGIAIRTTFIAGSPGETEQQHQELVQFVKDFGFEMMGVFPYSPEPGTPMGRLTNQLPDEVRQQRVEELMLAQQEVAFARAKKTVGKTIQVLVDRPAGRDEEDGYVARSQSQAPDIDSVTFVHTHGSELFPGQILDVKVTDYQAYDLVAELPKQRSRSLSVVR